MQQERGGSGPTRRVVAAIEALVARPDGLSTSALARETGASRSTLVAVLAELESAGWVRRAGPGWVVGPALRSVGATLGTAPDLRRLSRGPLEALADRTGSTAVLLLPNGDRGEVEPGGFLEVAEVAVPVGGRSTASNPMPVGHVVPLRAPGAREIAVLWDADRRSHWRADGIDFGDAAVARLDTVLEEVAVRGWSLERMSPGRRELLRMADALEHSGVGPLVRDRVGELFAELTQLDVLGPELAGPADLAVLSVAAAVRGRDGEPLASVAVAPGRRLTSGAVRRLGEAVRECAREIGVAVAG